MQDIYLDNNATTQLDPLVAERLLQLSQTLIANPSSQHRAGRQALALLESAKTDLLRVVDAPCAGMDTANIILTSGGTEANNLAVHSFCHARPGAIIVGATEHPSIIAAAQHSLLCGRRVHYLSVDQGGLHDLNQLEEWLKGEPVAIVSVMLGNNETGVLADLQAICQLCQRYSVPVHSDVVQAVGKVPMSMQQMGLSALTITAHKLHGPVGIGALIALNSIPIEPLLVGGGQQVGMRAGTEPVILAVAFAEAMLQITAAQEAGVYQSLGKLRDQFESAMLELPHTQVIAQSSPRLPHTSNISFGGTDRQALHMALDLAGVACSAGSACSSGSSRPSPILLAMGLPDDLVQSCLRFSFSKFTTASDVNQAIDIIHRVTAKLQNRSSSSTNAPTQLTRRSIVATKSFNTTVSEAVTRITLERPASVKRMLPELSDGWMLTDYLVGPENAGLLYLFDEPSIKSLASLSPVVLYGEKNLGKRLWRLPSPSAGHTRPTSVPCVLPLVPLSSMALPKLLKSMTWTRFGLATATAKC
ncbi:MAG: cysteine desulfurase family protein [Pirellulaceae bacterium]